MPFQRSKQDFSLRLPVGWKDTLNVYDHHWIGKDLFAKKGEVAAQLRNWWFPPPVPGPEIHSTPSVSSYYHKRIFLWAPRLMWKFDFKCPNASCSNYMIKSLTSKGLYNRVRAVIDLSNKYYMACEYLECGDCKKTFISNNSQLMEQLPHDLLIRFPAVVTRKYACDKSVVSLMRSRTLGNSPTALCNNIKERHTEEWMSKTIAYLSDCERHRKGRENMRLVPIDYDKPPEFNGLPSAKWFLAVYTRDVWSRLPLLKACATSVYGNILKIDSTKKITRKLQGTAAKSASWSTNVGNERGEVLISLMTTSESLSNLQIMADGLMDRYEKANQPHPAVLYTDRDCCNSTGDSKYQRLFHRWTELVIRMDSWHFMRRIAKACNNESHPLYGTFMAKVSSAIFEWDSSDVALLCKAKKAEMQLAGVSNPSFDAVRKAITKKELARHCRRKTRGTEPTIKLLEDLITSFIGATDTLGVELLRDDALEVWNVEKKHVSCLQDPEGLLLYTNVGQLTKGDILLPVYRCGRGTTSLESYHHHAVHFIPGK